jgi:hypothetical protein
MSSADDSGPVFRGELSDADLARRYGLNGSPFEDLATVLWRVREWFLDAAAAVRVGDDSRRYMLENALLSMALTRAVQRAARAADRDDRPLILDCRDAALAVLRPGEKTPREVMDFRLDQLERMKDLLELPAPAVAETPSVTPPPVWDDANATLLWRGDRIRCFRRQPAQNQIALIEAFHRARWAKIIPNPFRGDSEKLRQTVRDLNASLVADSIRFAADGSGEGVRWDPVE